MARLVDSGMPGNADSGFRHPTNRTSAQNDESGCAHAGTTDEALVWKATQELRSGPANATRQALVTSCTDAAIKDDRKNPGRGRGIRTLWSLGLFRQLTSRFGGSPGIRKKNN